MKNIYISILISLALTLLSVQVSYAAGSKSSENSFGGAHTPHPPHDHQENDHSKYLRGHGSDRKRKPKLV
jgi:hypothetical protein